MRVALTLTFTALTIGCGRTPEEAVQRALTAIETHDASALERVLDLEYADPLGDEHRLLTDVTELWERYPRIEIRAEDLLTSKGASELEATVSGTIDADFVGTPTWKVKGPLPIELVRRSDGFRIRSHLLTTFRDAQQLMDARRAALEANDVEGVRKLLHPDYRDGDLDADGAMQRLAGSLDGRKVRLQVSNYRLELRGPWAHLDEYYVLVVDDRPTRPLIARFTLKTTAGRWRIAAGLYPAN